ncbi:MAG: nucleotide pyrophosphatase/phosphodiesterase family protein, partial [Thermoanaerobaculia bacterium]
SERPRFLTLYFSDVDNGAHQHGPEPSPELADALRAVDAAVAALVSGLDERGLGSRVDLMIVSDHGMSSTSAERVVFLDDYIDVETANVVDWNPVLALWPGEDKTDEIYSALEGAHPHMAVYRGDEVPERYEFAGHERIAPIIGIADDGWSISSTEFFESCPQCFDGGTHGYDHRLPSMGALLIAYGPSFRAGARIGPIENIHLYNVMCAVLGIEPASNSGDPSRVGELIRSEASMR